MFGVNNFGKVVPGIYRSARPSLKAVRLMVDALRIRTIVDLTTERTPEELAEWRAELLRMGVTLRSRPLEDDVEVVDSSVVKGIVDEINNSAFHPVLIHCEGGRHRTGGVIAALRVWEHGWPMEQAKREADDHGLYGYWGHQGWVKFIKGLAPKGVNNG